MTMHEYLKDPEPVFSTSTARGKQAEYNFLKPANRNQRFIESLKSSVPLLSDHYQKSRTHSDAALPTAKVFYRAYERFSNKKGSDLSSVFHQSEFQNRLKNNTILDRFKSPLSHYSFNKVGTGNYMGPNADKFSNIPQVQNGRNRMFYSSQIFG